ncbi:MAG: quinohemoprotein amine dehydrogenase subunit beta [Sulfuricurvum sp.]
MNRNYAKSLFALCVTGFSLFADTSAPLAGDRDYIMTVTRPNNLILVDLKEEKTVRNCRLNGDAPPIGIVPSPDNKTAYIITDYAGSVNGYDIDSCRQVFHASLSMPQSSGKSLSGIAVSPDNKHLYAVTNQTKLHPDRYEVKDPLFMVFDTADGMEAKATRTYTVPRQITNISAADDGSVFMTGSQMYKLDPATGKMTVAKKLIGWNRKGFSDPDSTATYPIGQTTHEFAVMYTTYKYKDKTQNIDNADLLWGMTRVDLKTGKITQGEFNPYETMMFTLMTNPKDSNILYGVLNDLSKFDVKRKKLLKRVDVDHTYYSLGLSSDGKKVYLGSCLNDISVYDADTLDKLGNIRLPEGDMGTASFHVFHRL